MQSALNLKLFKRSNIKKQTEVDGKSHNGRQDYDKRRDLFTEQCGLKVLRITNDQVMNSLNWVMDLINSYPDIAYSLRIFRSALGKANALRSTAILRDRKRMQD